MADAKTDADASIKKKGVPPPEDAESIVTRRWILSAFWMVAIALGLPLWLWTTSIPRAQLPLQRMTNLAEGRSCQISYPLTIHLKSSALKSAEIRLIGNELGQRLNGLAGSQLLRFVVTSPDDDKSATDDAREAALTVNLTPDHARKHHEIKQTPWDSALTLSYPPGSDPHTFIDPLTEEIATVFRGEQQSISYLLGNTAFQTGREVELHPQARSHLDARTTRAFKYASSYHLTFSLFTSSHSPSAWEIDQALAHYLKPLLASLSTVSKFTIDTQVQLHAAFSPSIAGPVHNNETGQWLLQKSDLSGFINAAEWPLSPSIDKGPTINLVLYVPSAQQSPLIVAETGKSSWLVPQWGGVQILNRPNSSSDILSVDELGPVMALFAEQLTSLLGLPTTPSSFSLRIASLARERTTSLILSASSTLGALARLTLKLTSIAIPDSVAKSVDETINRLDQACADLAKGNYAAALESARIAEEQAESAFFEPSMVGQVYFPDEHKVAVYVPLLGPMAVPLVMAVVKEIKAFRTRKQKIA